MIWTEDDLESAARSRGISVYRVSQPLCVYGGEAYAMTSKRVLDPLDILQDWPEGDALLLYKLYMSPGDELQTVRFARGTGEPGPDDVL